MDRSIHLIGGVTRISAVFSGHFSHQIRFLHLPGEYHAPVRLNV